MTELRILVTGVGRRVELLEAFRQAALELKVNLKLYGADMTGTAPALAYCDFTRKVCSMKEERYISELIDICMTDKIHLVLPTIDTDLLPLAQNMKKFEHAGTKVLISELDKITICRDKNNTGKFFEACGLKAPKTCNNYREYAGGYPCFIKPKDGSSSKNTFKVENMEELAFYAAKIKDYIIQPFIEGREFTIDIFCDFYGNPIYITPRERVQVRAGEVLKTQICMDEVMLEESRQLIRQFKPCGPITVQLIQEKHTKENYYIEINPRFGGGAPLSMKAGAKSAKALLQLLCGEKVSYQGNSSCDGAAYSRFDQSVCISEGNHVRTVRGVIFDLDDTLYSEKEYVRSGYKKIAEYLGRPEAEERLWKYFQEQKPAVDAYLQEIGLLDEKDVCLHIYRNQIPDIQLYAGVLELIESLKENGVRVGIITDGRVEGQRNKLKALGLDAVVEDIIITDELGGVQFRKPCDIAFRIMQNRWRIPVEELVYVGDNLNKDFQAPRQLGMQRIYFKNMDGMYQTEEEEGLDMAENMWELKKKLMKLAKAGRGGGKK